MHAHNHAPIHTSLSLYSTNYDFRYDIQKVGIALERHASARSCVLLTPFAVQGLRPRRSIRTAMAHEINMYGEKTHLNAANRHF